MVRLVILAEAVVASVFLRPLMRQMQGVKTVAGYRKCLETIYADTLRITNMPPQQLLQEARFQYSGTHLLPCMSDLFNRLSDANFDQISLLIDTELLGRTNMPAAAPPSGDWVLSIWTSAQISGKVCVPVVEQLDDVDTIEQSLLQQVRAPADMLSASESGPSEMPTIDWEDAGEEVVIRGMCAFFLNLYFFFFFFFFFFCTKFY
jgi:hypothetical protein